MKAPRRLLFLFPALLAVVAALAPGSRAYVRTPGEPPFAQAPPPAAAVHRTYQLASPSRCDRGNASTGYAWPIAPFHEQHPIRGYFGDPRTVFRDSTDPQLGAFSFHNGVDIVAPAGTPVYPVVTGVVTKVRVDEVVVMSDRGSRIFQYWHIFPFVRLNDTVVAERTTLGVVTAPFDHVHLTEIEHNTVQNPLQPGHLAPYGDSTPPVVDGLYLRSEDGAELMPNALTGSVELVARAYDTPPLPAPEPWTGLPVSPARVGFELTTPSGRQVLPEQVPVDFEHTEPPRQSFWDVYVAGTFQNSPAVGKHLLRGVPGDYLYDLSPSLIDTTRLRPGRYVVTVSATDTCGNTGTLSERIRILPQKRDPDRRAASGSLEAWPGGARRTWTVVIASIPVREGLDAAGEAARLASDAGIADVGVLNTARIANLRQGSFIVFAGSYRTSDGALDALAHLAGLYPRAYVHGLVRRISRPGRSPVRPVGARHVPGTNR